MLAPIIEHEKAHVAAGEKTQAQADKQIAAATTRITDFVNGKAPAKVTGILKGARPGGRKGAAPTTTAPAGS